MLKSMAATAAFAGLHSVTASERMKQGVAELVGERQRNAFYRPLYIAESAVSLALLAWYIQRQPARVLWRVTGMPALAMRMGQAGWLAVAAASAHQVGILRMLGLDGLRAYLRGDAHVPPEPAAQGPAHDDETGGMRQTGAFRYSQHPLNFAFLPVFWLFPKMKTSLLGFSIAGSLYLWLGSFHEAAALEERYGKDYREYERSGVPFFAPMDVSGWRDALSALW